MKEILLFLVSCSILLLFCGSANSQNSDSDSILMKRVTFYVNQSGVNSALSLLASKARVCIGFVDASTSSADERKLSIQILKGTVKDVLNEIVKQDDKYTWNEAGQVINVHPSKNDSPIMRIARTTIPSVEFDSVELEDLGFRIFQYPQTKAVLERSGKKYGRGFKYSGPALGNPNVSLSAIGSSILEISNDVLRKGYARFWHLDLDGPNNEFVRLNFL